jgi:hypothetical protein
MGQFSSLNEEIQNKIGKDNFKKEFFRKPYVSGNNNDERESENDKEFLKNYFYE